MEPVASARLDEPHETLESSLVETARRHQTVWRELPERLRSACFVNCRWSVGRDDRKNHQIQPDRRAHPLGHDLGHHHDALSLLAVACARASSKIAAPRQMIRIQPRRVVYAVSDEAGGCFLEYDEILGEEIEAAQEAGERRRGFARTACADEENTIIAPAHERRVKHVQAEWLEQEGEKVRQRLVALVQRQALRRFDPSDRATIRPVNAPQGARLQNLVADEASIR